VKHFGGKSDENVEPPHMDFSLKNVELASKKYRYETETIVNTPGTWECLRVKVLDNDGTQVTEYVRNYYTMYATFCPFTRNGKDYLLYSKDYSATSLMELPSATELWSESRDTFGFCPVEFFVPDEGMFGFLSGCIWGDDSSWKLKCIDLRELEQNKITIFEPFGYCPLGGNTIRESIQWFYYDDKKNVINAGINTLRNYEYDLTTKELVRSEGAE
jgi:hypothetical protein